MGAIIPEFQCRIARKEKKSTQNQGGSLSLSLNDLSCFLTQEKKISPWTPLHYYDSKTQRNGVKSFAFHNTIFLRAVVSGGSGGVILAPPEFGSSVNPIPTRGGRLSPPHYW